MCERETERERQRERERERETCAEEIVRSDKSTKIVCVSASYEHLSA